jgi:hypothetical protein
MLMMLARRIDGLDSIFICFRSLAVTRMALGGPVIINTMHTPTVMHAVHWRGLDQLLTSGT